MQGTWGRRVFGRVITGETNTVFILEIDLGYETYRAIEAVPNVVVQNNKGVYKATLDTMTERLSTRIKSEQVNWE